MKLAFITVLVFLLSLAANAQLVTLSDIGGRPITGNAKSYDGSPYLFDIFKDIRIKFSGSAEIVKVQGRYNALDHMIEYERGGDVYELPLKNIDTLYVNEGSSEQIVYVNKSITLLSTEGLAQVAYKGVIVSLLLDITKDLNDQAVNGYGTNSSAKRIDTIEKFYLTFDNKILEFRNKKTFLEALPQDLIKRAEDYLKSNKVNFRSTDDLSNLLKSIE